MSAESFRAGWERLMSFVCEGSEAPSRVLRKLIREVESSQGYARNDVRAKAKTWLIGHVSSLGDEDILLARDHFGYLLPEGWGFKAG